MNSEAGSQWRKWDFHVHTPYSIINNQFGLSADGEGDFDEYVRQLFTKAVEKDVWAIGVTDYFSIDGYKRIRDDYLWMPAVMERLFPDQELRERIYEILVFPNIELRLDKFISRGSGSRGTGKPIGYHVIFSDKLSTSSIEENFLHKLCSSTEGMGSLPLTHNNIAEIGRQVKESNGKQGADYEVGLEHVTVADEDVRKILTENPSFQGQYIIAVPVDESLSSVNWLGRDYLSKRSIYHQCHCYMTSNPSTRKWALAEGDEGQRIAEFGSIKPCIWGSDAHSLKDMFEPAEHRYCWVKGDPTFDGLLQILCEPRDRIAIQEEQPEVRDPHRSIRSLKFNDDRFPSKPILFNEGLTCIIGGRSTGKSLLLRHLANAVDPEYAQKQEKRVLVTQTGLPGTATVTWRDGTSDERQIIYLPQTFLNRTVDDPQSSEGASGLIRGVLLQNEALKEASDEFDRACDEIERKLRSDIDGYLATKGSLQQVRQKLKANGPSERFRESEKRLQDEYAQLLGPENASLEEVQTYEGLIKRRDEIGEARDAVDKDITIMRTLPTPLVEEPSYNGIPCFDALTDVGAKLFRKELDDVNGLIARQWAEAVERVIKERESAKAALSAEREEIEGQIAALKPKMEHTGRLTQAMARLNTERHSLGEALKLEGEVERLEERLASDRAAILSSREAFLDASQGYCSKVSEITEGINSNLEFSADPVWRRDDFVQSLSSMLDARKFSGFARDAGYDLTALNDEDYTNEFLNRVWAAILNGQEKGSLQLKSGSTEGDFLRKVFGNWYNIHYAVTSYGDRLDQMSPGKKGLVLLELIIELERGNCPILIDQPEDDLDNESIYTELRKFIKDSKKRRQIIIVTHNANIALGADAEEIIVANQHGIGRENAGQLQFDYRSGAIENTVRTDETEDAPFLERYSIQEHVCQILEGGREALEQRRRKYSIGTTR